MRNQAQDRFIGQPEWNRRVGSATEELVAAIAKERGDSLDRGILPNSESQPKYSLVVTYVIGTVILACMGLGIWIGVACGY